MCLRYLAKATLLLALLIGCPMLVFGDGGRNLPIPVPKEDQLPPPAPPFFEGLPLPPAEELVDCITGYENYACCMEIIGDPAYCEAIVPPE